ncbi:DMT family transporter [Hyphobacterium sp. CCMP332]|uniref:DMT family transporter n=1 Tax=Hyphobacterium sp. CCMP332 TaxID=2749086 RepID=UPI00165098B6|nr:DMT family transporter [Hyphobacterium sp. CCMP332]QNL17951.1 DMT family transporter [Hyphobacterium sp. CCMP332]
MSDPQHPRWQDWTLLLFLAALWGTAFIFIRFSLDSLPPAALSFSRLTIAAILVTVFAYARGHRLPPLSDPRWKFFIFLGFFGNALPFFLIPLGQTQLPSALAGILLAIMPLSTVALAHFFANEKITGWKLAGFAVGFTGAVILIGPAALAGLGGPTFLAQLAIVGAALSYALNATMTRRAPPTHPAILASGALICSSIWGAPFGIWQLAVNDLPATVTGWGSLVWLAVGPTALATVLYVGLIARAGAGFMSLVNYLVPIVALFTGLAFGEAIGWNAYLGLVIILAGIALARRTQRSTTQA